MYQEDINKNYIISLYFLELVINIFKRRLSYEYNSITDKKKKKKK